MQLRTVSPVCAARKSIISTVPSAVILLACAYVYLALCCVTSSYMGGQDAPPVPARYGDAGREALPPIDRTRALGLPGPGKTAS